MAWLYFFSFLFAPPLWFPVGCLSYLHVGGEGFVRVLETVPVLAAQRERHPRQAKGTVLGDLRVHRLGPRRIGHGEVLVQQLLRDDILQGGGQGGDMGHAIGERRGQRGRSLVWKGVYPPGSWAFPRAAGCQRDRPSRRPLLARSVPTPGCKRHKQTPGEENAAEALRIQAAKSKSRSSCTGCCLIQSAVKGGNTHQRLYIWCVRLFIYLSLFFT